jgi:predicted nuclease of predicted toxin-antitoxin system
MTIFIDENLPVQLAHALQLLEKANNENVLVKSIIDEYGRGAKDEEWIPKLGQLKAFVITQDHNIHRKQLQKQLYQQHKVGLIVFKGPGKHGYTYWEMVENIIKHWRLMKAQIKKQSPPFAFVITPRSAKFQSL